MRRQHIDTFNCVVYCNRTEIELKDPKKASGLYQENLLQS